MKQSEKKKEYDKRPGGVYVNPSSGNVGLFSGDWPANLANEWEEDCRKNFNGIRWAKMWSDHLKAQIADSRLESVEVVQGTGKEESSKPEQKSEVVGAIGGYEHE